MFVVWLSHRFPHVDCGCRREVVSCAFLLKVAVVLYLKIQS